MIFAVTEEQIGVRFTLFKEFFPIQHPTWINFITLQVYELLRENIQGSSAGTLSADSSNIVELVQEQYEVRLMLTYVPVLSYIGARGKK